MTLGADALAAAARLLRTPHVFIYDAAVPDAARSTRRAASSGTRAGARPSAGALSSDTARSEAEAGVRAGTTAASGEAYGSAATASSRDGAGATASATASVPNTGTAANESGARVESGAAAASGVGDGSTGAADGRTGPAPAPRPAGTTADGGLGYGSASAARRGGPGAAEGSGGRGVAGEGDPLSREGAPGAGAPGLANALDLLAARAADVAGTETGAQLRARAHCSMATAAVWATHGSKGVSLCSGSAVCCFAASCVACTTCQAMRGACATAMQAIRCMTPTSLLAPAECRGGTRGGWQGPGAPGNPLGRRRALRRVCQGHDARARAVPLGGRGRALLRHRRALQALLAVLRLRQLCCHTTRLCAAFNHNNPGPQTFDFWAAGSHSAGKPLRLGMLHSRSFCAAGCTECGISTTRPDPA